MLLMYNIRISNESKKIRETLIELNNLATTPAPEEQQPPQQEEVPEPEPPRPPRPSVQTHQAFNQNQEESESNLESRLEEIFQKNAAQQEASEAEAAESSQGEFALNNSRKEEKKEASEGNNTSTETAVKKGSIRNSSISFSLVGRRAINIPNPIYTCDTSGRIVVNITVNATGDVVKTSINKNASGSTNECLTNMAMRYAADAKFSQQAGRNAQPGTITYNFQN